MKTPVFTLSAMAAAAAALMGFSAFSPLAQADEKPAAAPVAASAAVSAGPKSFSMIIHFEAKEGMAEKMVEFFKPCIAATRKEAGCLIYHLNREKKDGKPTNKFTLWETWQDGDSHKAHMAQQHTKDLLAGVKDYAVEGSIKADNYTPCGEP